MPAVGGNPAEIAEKRPGVGEMLDDVAADDPFEALMQPGDDLVRIALIDDVDSSLRDRGSLGIELDSRDATLLALLDRVAEGRLAAAELEDGFGAGRNAGEKVFAHLAAHGGPAVHVVG